MANGSVLLKLLTNMDLARLTQNTSHCSFAAYPVEVRRRRAETDTVVVWDGGHNTNLSTGIMRL